VTRRLTKADREHWDRLRHTVKPLRGKDHPEFASGEDTAVVAAPPKPGAKRKSAAATPSPPAKPAAPKRPALAPLEERTRRRLSRGQVAIEARIDLHGMQQERARTALLAFLARAQAEGTALVLVVTGKGREGGEGRGVLRRVVPLWLGDPALRALVIGFEEAAVKHGGLGALYVRIRRRRASRVPSPRL
jgi:DNA-nicking Smr family endonuclease